MYALRARDVQSDRKGLAGPLGSPAFELGFPRKV